MARRRVFWLGLALAFALVAITCVSLPSSVGASSDLEGFEEGDGELLEQSFSDDFAAPEIEDFGAVETETAAAEEEEGDTSGTERKNNDKKVCLTLL